MDRCTAAGCGARRHAESLCWRHLEEARRERGDRCSVEGCKRGRYYRGMCGAHATADSRRVHGRRRSSYERLCAFPPCGRRAASTRKHARFCSAECARHADRQARLPVLHPAPDPLTWLPAKHPALRRVKPAGTWWTMFVSGPCAWCDEPFTAVAASADSAPRYCSKTCSSAAGKYRHGKRFLIAPRKRLAIYERDGWVCQLCLEAVDPSLPPSDVWAATLDHIVCRSWGEPDDSPENLRLAHRWCNSVRGDESRYTVDDLRAA